MTVKKIPVNKEPKVLMIAMIPDKKNDLDKGYYNFVYVIQHSVKEDSFNSKEKQAEIDPFLDEEYMEDMRLDKKIEHHWRMVFEDNYGGVYNEKAIIRNKM